MNDWLARSNGRDTAAERYNRAARWLGCCGNRFRSAMAASAVADDELHGAATGRGLSARARDEATQARGPQIRPGCDAVVSRQTVP